METSTQAGWSLVAGRVRWWHVCLAAGAGLALLTAIGWAGEQWGGGPEREGVQRISAGRRPRRGGGGGGGRWKGKKKGGRRGGGGSKKSPETKVARVKQEIMQVLLWMERMERIADLPCMDDLLASASSPPSSSSASSQDGHEGDEGDGGLSLQARCTTEGEEMKEKSDEPSLQRSNGEGMGRIVRRTCRNPYEEEWSAAEKTRDAHRQRVESLLVSFARRGIDQQRAAFRRYQLSSFERYAVYETSERLGLTHRKEGDAIIISKLKFEIPAFDDSEDDAKSAASATEAESAGTNHEISERPEEESETPEEAGKEEEEEAKKHKLNVERCRILEECLTIALLDLDSLVECGEALPREERKQLVHVCHQLLTVLEAWKEHLQPQQVGEITLTEPSS